MNEVKKVELDVLNEIKTLSNLFTRTYFSSMKCKSEARPTLTRSQMLILKFVINNTARKKVYQKDIEKVFSIRRSTATEQLNKLEEMGLIMRKTSPLDRRLKEIILTDKALSAKRHIDESVASTVHRLTGGLSEAELETLKEILVKMKANILEGRNEENI